MSTREGRITFWGVEIFATVAEDASISAAARRLQASPATVSQQLSNLEAALGVRLLDRSARPIALTPAGETFLSRANAILSEAAQARAEVLSADPSALANLRLGMIEDFDADVTPRLLTEMSSELTNCRFLLETGPSHRLLDQLDARALDAAVAMDMDAGETGLVRHPLMTEPFILAVPASHKGAIADWSDLASLPLLQYTTRHYMGRKIASHLDHQGVRLPHRFELDSYHALLAMVASGAGWTVISPLGWMRAHRFRQAVSLHPLPGVALSRRISLSARPDLPGEAPARMAAMLRRAIDDCVVAPLCAQLTWLTGEIRVLPGE